MYVYPNGTITYFRELILTVTCQFAYVNIPSDSHECHVVAYIMNEFSDTAVLKSIDKFDSNREKRYLTWDIKLSNDGPVDVRWKTEPTGFSSGIKLHFGFFRYPNFFTKTLIVPSIILVCLAYITFWID